MKRRIAVFRGGPGYERELSLRSGKDALDSLADTYDVVDVVVDSEGNWIVNGFAVGKEATLARVDGAFNSIPGSYGEDGGIHEVLTRFRTPYLGSEAVPAALSLNKEAAKQAYKTRGLRTPTWRTVRLPAQKETRRDFVKSLVADLFGTFPLPAIVKPMRGGLSVGTSVYVDRNGIVPALLEAFRVSSEILIEEYIEGREATCSVVEGMRGKSLYAAPAVSIDRAPFSVYDYRLKHVEPAVISCPANLSRSEKETIEEWARVAHAALGLRHVSKSDFIVHPRRGVYIIETNSVPSYRPGETFLAPFSAVGSGHNEVFDVLGRLATGRE